MQGRLEEVRGIHRAARCGASTDNGVDLINEENAFFLLGDFLHDRLQALLEVTAVTRTGQQGAHVERPDDGIVQNFRNFAIDDFLGEAFSDGGLANAGVTDQHRIVLRPAAEDLDAAFDLSVAANQRVNLALPGLLIEVYAISFERFLGWARLLLWLMLGLFGPARRRRA